MKRIDAKYSLRKIVRKLFNRESVRDWMVWGTYGKSGREPLKWVTLKNMSNEHIQAILDTQPHITDFYKKEFLNELELREKNPELAINETV